MNPPVMNGSERMPPGVGRLEGSGRSSFVISARASGLTWEGMWYWLCLIRW